MMVAGSLVNLLGRPEIFRGLFHRRGASSGTDVLRDIELPLWVSAVGVPLLSLAAAWVTHSFFGVPWLLTLVALPLIFVLQRDLHQRDGADLVDAHRLAVEDHPFHDRRDRPEQPGQQPDPGRHDRRNRL
jgi:hypothetical protein